LRCIVSSTRGRRFRFLGISASEHIIAPRDATATPIWMAVKGDEAI